ncbi:unnamed protein product [Phyllotreta striolata]|uniref:Uncharacterized protein n=1 Tax=Phyllotreta striolata TaxID=444603 RepID=A0A9N9TI07_PHYSR|nr:unnamed protein product [Phyllotreta striolata]
MRSNRSIPVSQLGRLPKSKSRTAIRRDTRSVNLPVADLHNLEHYIVIPPDGGYGWVIVAVSFIAYFLIDGIGYTFGIFLSELSKEFHVHPADVAVISSYLDGFYYVTGPISCALCNRYGFRFVGMLGGLAAAGIFVSASYSEDFFIFTILIGGCMGVAFNFIYTSALLIVGFYFERYRALATSISVTGSSVGLMVLPTLFTVFEPKILDWRWKFRIIAASFLFLTLLIIAYKPLAPTKLLEQTPFQLKTDDSNSYLLEPNESGMGIKRIFDNYHNAVYPTIADYAANLESHARKPDEPFKFLAILPETSRSESMFRELSADDDGSAYRDDESLDSHQHPTCIFISCFRICRNNQNRKIGCKVTPPYASTRCRSKCCRKRNIFGTVEHINRPLYRDDILFQGSLATLPEYNYGRSRITIPVQFSQPASRLIRNISYHMSVSRVISYKDITEQNKCKCCPESILRVLVTMFDFKLFKSIAFCLITLSGFLTMMGLYIPFIFIVERARELKFKEPWPTQLLTALGVANMAGRIFCGTMSTSPKIDAMVLTWFTLLLGGFAVLAAAYARALISYVVMVVTFGFCVASFSTLRTVLLVDIVGLENLTNSFGISILFYGVAVFVGVPLSANLVAAYGTYRYCFMLAGAVIFSSGIILLPVNRINRYERNKRRHTVQFDEQIVF